MTRQTTDRLVTYAVLLATAVVVAIAFGEPALAALGTPFAVALVGGLAGARRSAPALEVTVSATPAEVVEGDVVEVRIDVHSLDLDGRLDLGLPLPPGLGTQERSTSRAITVRAGGTSTVVLEVEVSRWGIYSLGPPAVRVREPGGLFVWEGTPGTAASLRARPLRNPTRSVVSAYAAASAAGEHTSRTRSDGIEFADLRPYVHGDPARRLNWRASARRGTLVVNERHPERNTDVVLFIDTFSDQALADTVRVASALADAYLRLHDRVGLVSFGGLLSWLEPGGGQRQRERLEEALMGAESFASYAWKSLERVPPRTLPARCLVLAVSPLVDERARAALAAMAMRRIDLAVVEVPLESPEGFGQTWSGDLALRLHEMRHRVVRDRFLAMGVAIVAYDHAGGVEAAVREIDEYRRRARVRLRR